MHWKTDLLLVVGALLLGQLGVFYLAAYRCAYELRSQFDGHEELKALVVSDVHLLGKRRRSLVERLWIDMQISTSLDSAVRAHRPDVVLVLGDQLDEGGYPTSDSDFQEYVARFQSAFQSTAGIETVYLIGNHDSAFGRWLTPGAIARHERAFGPSNHVTRIKNHKIVHLNTMALDSDVSDVEIKAQAASLLQSLGRESTRDGDAPRSVLLLSHLPLYREDDMKCGTHRLREVGHVTYEHPSFKYETHHHVLSNELSRNLLATIQPDAILSGHTHAWCEYQHKAHGQPSAKEYTVPAFSWGQRPDPSYAVLVASGTTVRVASCALPQEPHAFLLYGASLSFLLLRQLWRCHMMSAAQRLARHAKKAT